MFKFYKPELNSPNLTGQVGGQISSYELSGYLGELFVKVSAPPVESNDTYYQYRKIYIKNDFPNVSNDTRCHLDAVQHPGQIAIALETGSTETIANSTIEPSHIGPWANPTNYANGLEIGTLSVGQHTGLWIRQSLNNVDGPDSSVSLRLYTLGIVE